MFIFCTEVRVLLALHYNNDNKNSKKERKKKKEKKKKEEIVVKAAGIRETTAGRYARNIME